MKNVNITQIQGVNANELLEQIKTIVTEANQKEVLPSNNTETVKLLTRKETASLLCVSLTTLHDWTKKGLLKPYRIGNRVRYKYAEILTALNNGKDE